MMKTTGIQSKLKWFMILAVIAIAIHSGYTQDVPVDKIVKTIKSFNFVTTTVGILTGGVSQATIDQLVPLQAAPPRSMRIFLTNSKNVWDIQRDFTFLVNDKKVEAIIIWPSPYMDDVSLIKNICNMSKRKKIPIISLVPGWLEHGAVAQIDYDNEIKVTVNEQVRAVMNYPIATETSAYQLVQQ